MKKATTAMEKNNKNEKVRIKLGLFEFKISRTVYKRNFYNFDCFRVHYSFYVHIIILQINHSSEKTPTKAKKHIFVKNKMDSSVNIKIKTIVQSILPESKVILFGSRAKGTYTDESDYDLLIITEEKLSEKEKLDTRSKIKKLLIKSLRKPVDVLLNMKKEAEIKKELPGHIVQWALKEGVEL